MTQETSSRSISDGDTPRSSDEVPPYGDPAPWARWLMIAAVAVAVLVVVLVAARKAWRVVARIFAGPPPWPAGPLLIEPTEVVEPAVPQAQPLRGRLYRCRFYDDGHPGSGVGPYEQLTDRRLEIFIEDGAHPWAFDQRLAHLGERCYHEVESRDGQRCFAPRLVAYNALGEVVNQWP